MKSIFSKTFFSSMFLTLAVICVSFLLMYLLMPRLYVGYKNDMLAGDLDEIGSRSEGQQLNEIKRIAAAKADEKGYMLSICDRDGNEVAAHGLQTVTSYTVDIGPAGNSTAVDEGEYEIAVNVLSDERKVRDAEGNELTVVLFSSLEPVDEAKNVILRLLPIVLAISVILTALFSYIHAKRITGPVESISESVKKMKTLDRDACCGSVSEDEIGGLAANINELYGRLMKAIDDLQAEYGRQTADDKEKIDFMLALSHELKTPLTSVRGMLECMQYNVGVYSDHETYLKECTDKVDEMTKLLNETLAASKLGVSGAGEAEEIDIRELINELRAEYELIAMKRGVGFDIGDISGKHVIAPRELMKKALSNIISNAFKYSDKDENVKIFADADRLVIENVCPPLNAEEAQSMFLPFVRKEGSAEGGHGLGLYITDRILKVCGPEYSFEPFEKGMRFTIYI